MLNLMRVNRKIIVILSTTESSKIILRQFLFTIRSYRLGSSSERLAGQFFELSVNPEDGDSAHNYFSIMTEERQIVTSPQSGTVTPISYLELSNLGISTLEAIEQAKSITGIREEYLRVYELALLIDGKRFTQSEALSFLAEFKRAYNESREYFKAKYELTKNTLIKFFYEFSKACCEFVSGVYKIGI